MKELLVKKRGVTYVRNAKGKKNCRKKKEEFCNRVPAKKIKYVLGRTKNYRKKKTVCCFKLQNEGGGESVVNPCIQGGGKTVLGKEKKGRKRRRTGLFAKRATIYPGRENKEKKSFSKKGERI